MRNHTLTAVGIVIIAALTGVAILAVSKPGGTNHQTTHAATSARATNGSRVAVALSARPDAADSETINDAGRLRQMALAPNRTAYYRAFTAYMGLSRLVHLHPLLPGRCSAAVSYLYDNLLDLRQAYPGRTGRRFDEPSRVSPR